MFAVLTKLAMFAVLTNAARFAVLTKLAMFAVLTKLAMFAVLTIPPGSIVALADDRYPSVPRPITVDAS